MKDCYLAYCSALMNAVPLNSLLSFRFLQQDHFLFHSSAIKLVKSSRRGGLEVMMLVVIVHREKGDKIDCDSK